jgi:hypothetical protein
MHGKHVRGGGGGRGRGGGGGRGGRGGQFRGAVSTYDKREVIQKQRNLKAKKVNKYRKTLKKLEAEGRLGGSSLGAAGGAPDDLDQLFGGGDGGRAGRDDSQSSGSGNDNGSDSGSDSGDERQQQHGKPHLPGAPAPKRAAGGTEVADGRGRGRVARAAGPVAGAGAQQQRQQQPQQQALPPPPAGGKARPSGPSALERLAVARKGELERERVEHEEVRGRGEFAVSGRGGNEVLCVACNTSNPQPPTTSTNLCLSMIVLHHPSVARGDAEEEGGAARKAGEGV